MWRGCARAVPESAKLPEPPKSSYRNFLPKGVLIRSNSESHFWKEVPTGRVPEISWIRTLVRVTLVWPLLYDGGCLPRTIASYSHIPYS